MDSEIRDKVRPRRPRRLPRKSFTAAPWPCVLLLGVALMSTGCPRGKARPSPDSPATTASATPTPTPAPLANVAGPSADALRGWHGTLAPGNLGVTELPLQLPRTDPHAVFDYQEAFTYSQPILGGNGLTQQQQQALGDYLSRTPRNNLYINGGARTTPDLIGDVGREQFIDRFARGWANNMRQLGQEYKTSVEYRWGSAAPPPSLPESLATYIRGEFESLKAGLTPEQRARLGGWVVETAQPPDLAADGESLWLKVSPGRRVVWMSPGMVRALLLYTAHGELVREYVRNSRPGAPPIRFLANPEVAGRVSTNFRGAVRLLLAHLMSHVYLEAAEGTADEREARYEQAARQLVGNEADAARRLLRDFIRAATSDGEAEGWGVEQAGDLSAVLARYRD